MRKFILSMKNESDATFDWDRPRNVYLISSNLFVEVGVYSVYYIHYISVK
jgi:hypothetical protein